MAAYSYHGYHATLYDLFYRKKPYKKEVLFIHDCFEKYSSSPVKNILELACGTCNHTVHFSRHGYWITATDYSKDMLEVAKEKTSEIKNIEVRYMNMLKFDRFRKPFDAIVCLFDSIGYLNTNNNILKVLKGVNRNLRKNGLFIFEFWNAGAMLSSFEPVRIRSWKIGNEKIVRKSETKIRYSEQLADVKYTISIYDKRGKQIREIKEIQTNRYFLIQEINLFLSMSGFEPVKWFDGYSNKTVNENSWHTVCIAKRKQK